MGGRLLFCGHSYDLPRRLAGIDIFVLPSLTEGFPLILLEAAATGCAMVASQVGGIPELIENGVQGILVPPADVTALARAIASLIRDPVKAGRLARACRDRVRSRYSLEQMLFRTASLYRQLAGKRGARCPVLLLQRGATGGEPGEKKATAPLTQDGAAQRSGCPPGCRNGTPVSSFCGAAMDLPDDDRAAAILPRRRR